MEPQNVENGYVGCLWRSFDRLEIEVQSNRSMSAARSGRHFTSMSSLRSNV